jgi:DNA-binding LacI/PurR family transcriptional regulator
MTVHRTLRALESEGLLAAEPGKGYRVQALANDPLRDCPLAYVLSGEIAGGHEGAFYMRLNAEIESAARARGLRMVGLVAGQADAAEVFSRLEDTRAWGLIVDSMDEAILDRARKSGLPAVAVDIWDPGWRFDAVTQDNVAGGELAATWLAERGHTRIGWFGPLNRTRIGKERHAGAVLGLTALGLTLGRSMDVDIDDPELPAKARELLSGSDRPTAVLALWMTTAVVLRDAARDLGLTPGRDFDVVSWCAREILETTYARMLGGEAAPPAVTWSIRTMAETAISRLLERRASPRLPPIRMTVPVYLQAAKPDSAKRG